MLEQNFNFSPRLSVNNRFDRHNNYESVLELANEDCEADFVVNIRSGGKGNAGRKNTCTDTVERRVRCRSMAFSSDETLL